MEDSSDEDKDNEKDGVFEEESSELHEQDEHQFRQQQQQQQMATPQQYQYQQLHQQQSQGQHGGSGGRDREHMHTSRTSTSSSTLTPTTVTSSNCNLLSSGGHGASNYHNYWEHQNKENSGTEVSASYKLNCCLLATFYVGLHAMNKSRVFPTQIKFKNNNKDIRKNVIPYVCLSFAFRLIITKILPKPLTHSGRIHASNHSLRETSR